MTTPADTKKDQDDLEPKMLKLKVEEDKAVQSSTDNPSGGKTGQEKLDQETASVPVGGDTVAGQNNTPFILATINMGNGNDNGVPDVDGANIRRERVEKYLKDVKPDIVFAQQIAAPRSENWRLNVDGYGFLSSGTSNGVVYKRKLFHRPKVNFSNPRFCGALLPLRLKPREQTGEESDEEDEEPASRLMCISWNEKYKIHESEKTKGLTRLFRTIHSYLGDYSTEKKPITKIVIGGSFHLKANDTKENIPGFELLDPPRPACYNYFMYQALDNHAEAPRAKSAPLVCEDEYVRNPRNESGCLRHRPVRAEVFLAAPQQKVEPGPDANDAASARLEE